MTAEEVLAMMEVSDGDMSEVSSDERSEDELELEDPDEPIIKGSDDDFSDLSSVKSEEEDEGFQDHSSPCIQTPPHTIITITANGPNSALQPTTPSLIPSTSVVLMVLIVSLSPPHGLLLCILSPSTPSLLPLILLSQLLHLHWRSSHASSPLT